MVSAIHSNNLFMPIVQGFAKSGTTASASALNTNSAELSPEEEKQVQELRARDQEVRAHENAHKTAGGGYVGSISYENQTGPDGREYAIGGEAQIDASPIPGKPEETIRKMDIVIRAALAPAEPSSQDYAVARSAQQARLEAQRQLNSQEGNPAGASNEERTGGLLSNLALLNEEREKSGQSIIDRAKIASENLMAAIAFSNQS